MSKKLKLTKITLETKDGKTVELSLDEARDLHSQLDSLFGSKYIPTQPVIIERDRWPYRPYWSEPVWYSQTTCSLTGDSGIKATLSCADIGVGSDD